MAKVKISQLPAKSANLAATDLLEVSEVSGLGYVSKKITGAELVGDKVPYTGATSDVDLGEYELKAGQIELDQSPTGTAGVAVTRWNDTVGATETTLKGGNVVLKNGVDLIARVVNKVTPAATLTKAGYKVVKISGAQGQRLAVGYAQANNDNNSADTLGVVCDTIAANQEGFIMTVGQLEEINTTGSLQSETWADGDVLYLSPTTPGAMTNVKPNGSTGHIVVVGYVEHAHAVHGKIYVKVMNGWELDELHNVYIDNGTLANNDALIYESSTSLWKNKTIATALGYTPISSVGATGPITSSGGTTPTISTSMATNKLIGRSTAGTGVMEEITVGTGLTLSGGTLSSSGVTVGTTAVTSGTNGRVFFQAGGVVQQDGAFNWDNTNKRLGIGANATSPSSALFIRTNLTSANDVLDIQNGQYGNPLFRIRDMSTASPIANFFFSGLIFGGNSGVTRRFDLGGFGLGASYGDFSTNAVWENNQGNIGDGQGTSVISVSSNLYVNLQTTKKYKFEAVTGNFGIGNVGSLGARLDVRAQGALSTDIAFRVRNSADNDNLIESAGNGLIKFRTGTERIEINTSASDYKMSLYKFGVEMTRLSTYSSYFCFGGSNQYLGIGTNAPSHLLDIYSSVTPILTRWTNDENNLAGSDVTLKFTTRYTGGSQGGNPMAYLTAGGTGAGVNLNNKSYFKFLLSKANTLAERASITSQSNLLLQAPTEDTNDVGVIYIPNGTAPTGSITDGYKQYSADITADNAAPHFRTENGSIIKLYQNAAVTNSQGIANALTNLGVLASSTIVPTVQSVASAATVTPTFTNDLVKITAQAVALTLAAPTGTAIDGKDLMIRIKDNGTAQTIAWTSGTGGYRAIGVTLPTTTTAGKTTYVGLIYNSDDSIWDVIGVTTQA